MQIRRILFIGAILAGTMVLMPGNVYAQQAAQSARQAKDDSRDTVESAVRALVNRLQVSDDVDDTERAAMGITVRDTIRTAAAGDITTRPIGVVDCNAGYGGSVYRRIRRR